MDRGRLLLLLPVEPRDEALERPDVHRLHQMVVEAGRHRLLPILLAQALALIFPIDWPEPFGIVVIEALASGTPVIARRRGSVPELVTDGQTGIVCETEDEMVDAVTRVTAMSRSVCRADFERRFTVKAMTDAYLRVYDRVRAGIAAGARVPDQTRMMETRLHA